MQLTNQQMQKLTAADITTLNIIDEYVDAIDEEDKKRLHLELINFLTRDSSKNKKYSCVSEEVFNLTLEKRKKQLYLFVDFISKKITYKEMSKNII